MSDIIKIKARKHYDWSQDSKYLFIKVPVVGETSGKNIEIYLSDLILRVSNKNKKSVTTLDLEKEVEYLSAENKFVVEDGMVNAIIKKKNQGEKWERLLVEDISLAELKARRKESELKYEKNIRQFEQNKEKLRNEYDRQATRELMKFEEKERNILEKRKQTEKQAALNQVFKNVSEKTGKIEDQSNKWNDKGEKDLQAIQKQQEQQRTKQKQQRKKFQQQKYVKQYHTEQKHLQQRNHKQIFDESDLKLHNEIRDRIQQQKQEIPIRKQNKVNVKFTEKIYPNVATRDYHYTEPPMPKGALPMPPPRQGGLQNTNPLWLKDKGDMFMRDRNYTAALDAYSEALKIDPSQIRILMNRTMAHIKLFNLDAAIHDCDSILLEMQKSIMNNQENANQSLVNLIKIKTRKGLCLAWKGRLKQAKELLEEQLSFPIDLETKQQIQHCLQAINKREQSILTKLKGDECVKKQLYQQAIIHYDTSIGIDMNEYSLSNKCLCLNKINKFQESIENADEGIKIVEQFITQLGNSNAKNNEENASILMKLLYRKAIAQQNLKQVRQAQQTLRKALTINPQDRDIKEALHSLKYRESSQQFLKLKQSASKELVEQSNPQQALKIYEKCLKILQSIDNPAEYLSILQNQCVCYLKLEQFDNVISVSIRILSIVNSMKNKIVQLGQKKTAIPKATLNKITVRTLLRRANAYLKTGQMYNAKSDLEKAVQIEPEEQSVVKELQKLKESLGIR